MQTYQGLRSGPSALLGDRVWGREAGTASGLRCFLQHTLLLPLFLTCCSWYRGLTSLFYFSFTRICSFRKSKGRILLQKVW